MTEASHGTGPGVITPDGCAVEFYARMTAAGFRLDRYLTADHAWLRAVPAG